MIFNERNSPVLSANAFMRILRNTTKYIHAKHSSCSPLHVGLDTGFAHWTEGLVGHEPLIDTLRMEAVVTPELSQGLIDLIRPKAYGTPQLPTTLLEALKLVTRHQVNPRLL
mmetsp:Transcript_52151/g.71188  ORF Transcript_52151/g.71188 Transcript_52151/m.71188 type:complete len:112 (-) Transcript_52151:162-497(-)